MKAVTSRAKLNLLRRLSQRIRSVIGDPPRESHETARRFSRLSGGCILLADKADKCSDLFWRGKFEALQIAFNLEYRLLTEQDSVANE